MSKIIGSRAVTVQEVIRCPAWAVYLDGVIEELPHVSRLSGPRVRKWMIMTEEFTVDTGEIDGTTGQVRRAFLQHKYRSLLDTLYN